MAGHDVIISYYVMARDDLQMKLCSGTSSLPLSFTAALTLFAMGSSTPPAETSLSFGVSPALVLPLKRLAISCLTSDNRRTGVQHHLHHHASYQSIHHGDTASDGSDEHCFKWAYWRAGCLLPSADTPLKFSGYCSRIRGSFAGTLRQFRRM